MTPHFHHAVLSGQPELRLPSGCSLDLNAQPCAHITQEQIPPPGAVLAPIPPAQGPGCTARPMIQIGANGEKCGMQGDGSCTLNLQD